MGTLTYEQSVKADFDDRVLAHLQVVIGSKLRRGEAFYFSWRTDQSLGDGRMSIWLNPRSSLVFKYFGSRAPRLNAAWVDALADTANSPSGLYVVPEPTGGPTSLVEDD
ncbi:ATP-dependent DNA ligase [Microbacterium sp. W1N]|uniref:DUF7882 family protein n=1 Tax=Microbacterium festucae TaxID=2977531 RepID=UPI0021BF0BBD|nr:ATP-dependent DNA ligase [Microbacterium festucae]MCT9821261.1 ATP-dependent DNA ligase [Microbacterium festucae]